MQRLGGGALLNQHGGSLARALSSVYGRGENAWAREEREAEACRAKMPNGHWRRPDAVRRYLAKLAALLGVAAKEDWYRVSRAQMALVKPSPPHAYSLLDLLEVAYPTERWDAARAGSAAKKASQRGLGLAVRSLFSEPALSPVHM